LHSVKTRAEGSGDAYTINGTKAVVLNGGRADKLVVLARTAGADADKDGLSLFLVDANDAGVQRQAYKLQDGSNGAEVQFNNAKATLIGTAGEALPVVEAVMDRALLAVCAEAVGAMEVSTAKTVEYTKTRVQFGVPISKFQALQHRMADMFIEQQQAKSILVMAAMKLDQDPVAGRKAVAAAKYRIGKAARKVGQESVQIHGGIGVTDELDVGHFFKRLTMLEMLFGNSDYHGRRFAGL
ncbi:MAG: acyl-CoA dehydrogenase, partial [Cellvibrionaceae bacterium]|nr:acyl-CoA dehydrogenase [Cellvibrionaceae bacterium]